MTGQAPGAAERTNQGVAALREGLVDDARALFAEALTIDPDYAVAWRWLAAISNDPGEQRYALERVQDLDPDERTAARLSELSEVEPTEPSLVTVVAEAPPEDFDLAEFARPHQTRLRRRRRWWATAAVLCLAAVAAGYFVAARPPSPVYIAVVGGFDGDPDHSEIVVAAREAAADINAAGGVDGHPLRLKEFDDANDETRAAAIATTIARDGDVIAVVGHRRSTTSGVAFPVYAKAGIPVITPGATADSLTRGNPWAFRTIYDNTTQATGIVAGLTGNGRLSRVYVISVDTEYGRSLWTAFSQRWTGGDRQITGHSVLRGRYPSAADLHAATTDLARAFTASSAVAPPQGVLLFAPPEVGVDALKSLRAAGWKGFVVSSDLMATGDVVTALTTGADAQTDISMDFFSVPIVKESLTGGAVAVVRRIEERTGRPTTWLTPTSYEAVTLIRDAVDRAGIAPDGPVADVRDRLRASMSTATDPGSAFPGIGQPLYFTADRSAVMPTASLRGWRSGPGRYSLQPAYLQLGLYASQGKESDDQARAQGRIVSVDGVDYALQHVARIGLNLNEISQLDTTTGEFYADAFLWIRNTTADKVADIEFVNAAEPITLGSPLRTSTGPLGDHYALYRIRGRFKAQLDFRDFPFDRQSLRIVLQNKTVPSTFLVYAPDPDLLDTSTGTRLRSGADVSRQIDDIPNWSATQVDFSQQVVGSSAALGDPSLSPNAAGVTYSQFVADIQIGRDVGSFLVKNVLPLMLLVLVTYIALWTPGADLATRVSFGVTGILTGAVMLNDVTSSLPNVDYSVAIQWAYYAFILISAAVVLESIYSHRLHEDGRLAAARRVDIAAKVAYPLAVLAVIYGYWARFRG